MVAEAVSLAATIDYLKGLGMEAMRAHEISLMAYAMRRIHEHYDNDLVVHGPLDTTTQGGVPSFAHRDVHPHDITQVLDQYNVCVRARHHCAKLLMQVLGLAATTRASLYMSNNESGVNCLVDALAEVGNIIGRVEEATQCQDSKTSTVRSSLTTTSPHRTTASSSAACGQGEGVQPAVRRRDGCLFQR